MRSAPQLFMILHVIVVKVILVMERMDVFWVSKIVIAHIFSIKVELD